MTPRVWVVGATGFIGGRLRRQLARRARVLALSRRPGRGCTRLDLGRVDAVRRLLRRHPPDVIFHCAGTTRALSARGLFRAHERTTRNLLDAVHRNGPPYPRLVLLGSAAEYGPGPRRKWTESSPGRPNTPYGKSKRRQTRIALGFARRGVPVLVARVFNIIDAGVPPRFAVGRFVRLLRRKNPAPAVVGSLNAVRDFVTARDVAEALWAVGRRGRPGQVYNVCSGVPLSLRRLWREMAAAAKAAGPVVESARGSARSSVEWCVGSPAKIYRHTGWRARENPLALARRIARG